MFTIKLKNNVTGRIHIEEGGSVDVIRENGIVKVSVRTLSDVEKIFIVGKADSHDFDVAFVENSWGRTTQIVKV